VVLGHHLLIVVILILLMENIRWLDPTGSKSRYLAQAMIVTWCAGLGLWLLGIVRRYNSRFSLKTLVFLTAGITLYLALVRAMNPVIPIMVAGACFSVAMLSEAQRIESQPYRGWLSRTIMGVGGLLFLAHSIRVLGYFGLFYLGWVKMVSR
jgi:hypothetical protein